MRLLIYGAGVIGCWYAALFSKAGYDTTIYARGKRLDLFQKEGLRYDKKGKIHKADVKIIGRLEKADSYDFVFLTVKENQVHTALEELSHNISPNIVTMVNTIEGYEKWERLCGEGRIIPAFPGAGGSFQDGILKAALTSYLIQPTTFAEINGLVKRVEENQHTMRDNMCGMFKKIMIALASYGMQEKRDLHYLLLNGRRIEKR